MPEVHENALFHLFRGRHPQKWNDAEVFCTEEKTLTIINTR